MRTLAALLALVFLLTSCAPAALAVPTDTPQPTATLTPSPTATQTPTPTPTITPTPTSIGGGSGKLIFEYYRVAFEKSFPELKGELNIFTSNVDGTDLTPVTNGLNGLNRIESIWSDGQILLFSSRANYAAKGDLYLVRLDSVGSAPSKLASGLTGSKQAIFLDSTHIVFIGQGREGYGFYVTNIGGTDPKKIGAPIGKASGLISSDKTRIYWWAIQNTAFRDNSGALYMYGDFQTLWWTNIDGSGQGKLESNERQIAGRKYAFSHDDKRIAWIPEGLEPNCSVLYSLNIWTPEIRDGSITSWLRTGRNPFISKNSPHLGKTIDLPYVENYVRQCFLMHVASLSNMNDEIKIPLILPFDPAHDDFMYHSEYDLTWWPDGSKILAYDAGEALMYDFGSAREYPLTLYEVALEDANPHLVFLQVLEHSAVVQPVYRGNRPHLADGFSVLGFSPDGRQILLSKFSRDRDSQGQILSILDLRTMNYATTPGKNITPDMQVQRIGSIYWLP